MSVHDKTPLQTILELIYGDITRSYKLHLRDPINSSTVYYYHDAINNDCYIAKIPGVFTRNGLTQSKINTYATPVDPTKSLHLLTKYITMDWILYQFQLLGEPSVRKPSIIKTASIIHYEEGFTSRVVNSYTPSFGTCFEIPNSQIQSLLTTYHLGIVLGEL